MKINFFQFKINNCLNKDSTINKCNINNNSLFFKIKVNKSLMLNSKVKFTYLKIF